MARKQLTVSYAEHNAKDHINQRMLDWALPLVEQGETVYILKDDIKERWRMQTTRPKGEYWGRMQDKKGQRK